MKLNKFIVVLIYGFTVLGVAACSGVNFTDWRFPYMYPVQQGNYITDAQITQLKAGMTKEQVSFVIGHPVSQFMFNSTQWQYIYQMHNNNKLKNSYIININFDTAEKLTTVESAGEVFVK